MTARENMIGRKLIAIVLVLYAANALEKIPITMVTTNPFNAESRSPYPQYYCYLSSSDADAVVSSRRVLDIRNDRSETNHNQAPPNPDKLQSNTYPPGSAVYVVFLDFGGNSEVRAFGTFSCDASSEGKADTTVSNILMDSRAHTFPEDGLVTQTVNIRDNGVDISMTGGQSVERWWRNKKNIISSSDYDFSSGNRILSFTSSIRRVDEGVYQTISASTNKRQSLFGLRRLIVRSCSTNHWAPPTCYGVCDNCYNGGVCDDETGKCICPPGFMGPNCLTACSDNHFGLSCEFQCDPVDCEGLQFCLLDPYGCTCGPGWSDLDCRRACAASTFGASCLQECHCDGTCDRFTGSCDGTCEPGWRGFNCQIPDFCQNEYYGSNCTSKCNCRRGVSCDNVTGECPNQECGPAHMVHSGSVTCQECLGAFFGQSCQQECHCAEESCNKLNGQCSGQCRPQWLDVFLCSVGFVNITSSKFNPGASTEVNCTCQDEDNCFSLNIYLSREDSRITSNDIEEVSSEYSAQTGVIRFRADNVTDGDKLFCLAVDEDEIVAVLNITVLEYNLPVLMYGPSLVSADVSSITIQWRAWDADRDEGDPPIVAYNPYYRNTSTNDWTRGPTNSSLTYTVEDLKSDTLYEFSVAAVREGQNGEGPMSPVTGFRTNCKLSEVIPVDVVAHLITNSFVNVSWQVPKDIMCTTGISFFFIYSEDDGSTVGPELRERTEGDVRWVIVNDLEGGNYTFLVTLTIGSESDFSERSEIITITKDTSGTNETAVEGPDNSPLIIIVILVLVIFILSGAAVFIYMRKRKATRDEEQYFTQTVGYNQNGITGGLTNNAYNGLGNSLTRHDDKIQVKSLGDETESEDEIKEGEEDGDDQEGVYGNLKKPEAIKVDSLQGYVKLNLSEGRLEQEFSLLNPGKQYPWTVGEKIENKLKNRFRNLYTYDHSRVILAKLPGDEYSDYYNASHIMTPDGKRPFIAAQGPNTASLPDFWRMIWSNNFSTIVMVTNLVEKGRDRCLRYWPEALGSSQGFGDIEVTWKESNEYADYIVRKLHIVRFTQSRVVHQLHFISWPDMGTPKQPTPLISFTQHARHVHNGKTTPILVHCSAGIGRTGTFIALYSLLDVICTEEYINVFKFVEMLRESRINMVQTGKQYVYLYNCLVEAYLTKHTEVTRDRMKQLAEDVKQDVQKKEFELLQAVEKDENVFVEYLKRQVNGRRPFSISEMSYNLSLCIEGTLLKSYKKNDAYVSIEYPQESTVLEGLWKLVYRWNCPLIVSLDQPDDKSSYWPENDSVNHSVFTISCKSTEIKADFTVRQLEVTMENQETAVIVHHLQFTSGAAREDLDAFMGLVKEVLDIQKTTSLEGPTVVTSVDGGGLCGVFVAVLSEIERLQDIGQFDVFKTVRQLKETNDKILETESDYCLCYKMLFTYLQQGSRTYENV